MTGLQDVLQGEATRPLARHDLHEILKSLGICEYPDTVPGCWMPCGPCLARHLGF